MVASEPLTPNVATNISLTALPTADVMVGDVSIDLSPTEFKLLLVMAQNPRRVFTRMQLMDRVHGYAFEGYERTIDAHIKNLRQKIEPNPRQPQYIVTVFGVGYKLEVPTDAP